MVGGTHSGGERILSIIAPCHSDSNNDLRIGFWTGFSDACRIPHRLLKTANESHLILVSMLQWGSGRRNKWAKNVTSGNDLHY